MRDAVPALITAFTAAYAAHASSRFTACGLLLPAIVTMRTESHAVAVCYYRHRTHLRPDSRRVDEDLWWARECVKEASGCSVRLYPPGDVLDLASRLEAGRRLSARQPQIPR